MNSYVRLTQFKEAVRTERTADDARLERLCEAVSREIDNHCNRSFVARTDVRYYARARWWEPHRLKLFDDVISVSAVGVDDDEDYDYTDAVPVVDTHVWLADRWRPNEGPYRTLELIQAAANTTLRTWPTFPRAIRVTGVFGYSNETEACATLAEALDASETGVDVAAGHGISVGETIVVESEQMAVTAVNGNTLTVTRGYNGSTAATHADTTTVYRRRYPRPVEEAAMLSVARLYRDAVTGLTGNAAGGEFGFSMGTVYPIIRDYLAPYVVVMP